MRYIHTWSTLPLVSPTHASADRRETSLALQAPVDTAELGIGCANVDISAGVTSGGSGGYGHGSTDGIGEGNSTFSRDDGDTCQVLEPNVPEDFCKVQLEWW